MDTNISKKWVAVPLGLSLIILLGVNIFLSKRSMQQQIDAEVESHVDSVMPVLQSELAEDAKLMHALIDIIQEDTSLRRAWIAGDRQSLLRRSSQIFEAIRSEHRVSHFYFHSLNRVNYLRVHKPSRSGDFIDRYTLKAAAETAKLSQGIELGPYGTFTLRVVMPWVITGEIVGYIELGQEIEHLTPRLKNILGIELFFFVDKKNIERKDWEDGLRIFKNSGKWNQFRDILLIDKTMLSFPEQLTEGLISDHRDDSSLFHISHNARQYSAKIFPSKDVSGAEVGVLIVLYEISSKKVAELWLIFFQAVSFVVVFMGLFLFLSAKLAPKQKNHT